MFKWFFFAPPFEQGALQSLWFTPESPAEAGFFLYNQPHFSDSLAAARDLLAVVLRVRLTGPRTGDWATHE